MVTRPHFIPGVTQTLEDVGGRYTVSILRGNGRRNGLYCQGDLAEVMVTDRNGVNVTHRFVNIHPGTTGEYLDANEVNRILVAVRQAF
jgi:hypothetical protein